MRWPLRNQVLLPMLCVMFATLIGVSVLNAVLSVRRERWRIEHELQGVADTLENSSFPLTDAVLRQMRGLSGAEYVLCDGSETVVASTLRNIDPNVLPDLPYATERLAGELEDSVVLDGRRFHHARLPLRRPGGFSTTTILHVLYPEESYREAWWRAVLPPMIVGGCALLLVVALGLAVTSRVTRPLHRLQAQTEEIATGSFQQLPVPARDDEIADLSRSVNRMVEMLARYESEVRRSEQMRTLGQLGGGIGHQMRNAVTGCRLAIELHARKCLNSATEDECLTVAMRQLELMEQYLNRFLALGRTASKPHVTVDLVAAIDNVMQLVRPAAGHVNVKLTWQPPRDLPRVQGDPDELVQLLVNLVLNAIEAAAQVAPRNGSAEAIDQRQSARGDGARNVTLAARAERDRVRLEILDSGPGPASDVLGRLFEPFVTEKPDGTGLGLWVAKEIVAAHHGEISWCRREEITCFTVELPIREAGGNDG